MVWFYCQNLSPGLLSPAFELLPQPPHSPTASCTFPHTTASLIFFKFNFHHITSLIKISHDFYFLLYQVKTPLPGFQVAHDLAQCYLSCFPLLPNMFPFLWLGQFFHCPNLFFTYLYKPVHFCFQILTNICFSYLECLFFFPLTQVISILQENCPCLLCPFCPFLLSLLFTAL